MNVTTIFDVMWMWENRNPAISIERQALKSTDGMRTLLVCFIGSIT